MLDNRSCHPQKIGAISLLVILVQQPCNWFPSMQQPCKYSYRVVALDISNYHNSQKKTLIQFKLMLSISLHQVLHLAASQCNNHVTALTWLLHWKCVIIQNYNCSSIWPQWSSSAIMQIILHFVPFQCNNPVRTDTGLLHWVGVHLQDCCAGVKIYFDTHFGQHLQYLNHCKEVCIFLQSGATIL